MKDKNFKDHFSDHALTYARARPSYPKELYQAIAGAAPSRNHLWDCGCGNGQATKGAAPFFKNITATDASAEQIQAAVNLDGVVYRTAPAEKSGLADASVDAVTVAQALHWFHFKAFFDEVARVAVPKALLAVWTYDLCEVTPDIDALVGEFYRGLAAYWPPERRFVEDRYESIDFPFQRIAAPQLEMGVSWTRSAFYEYIRSWSAFQRCARESGANPLRALMDRLNSLWPEDEIKTVRWPLTILFFRV